MNSGRGSSIFISYRRDDTAWPARQVYDVVAREFRADRVFKDVDNIEPGEDFVQSIGSAVAACDVLLVLIGPRWLSTSDVHGSRRLDDPNDFVRLEIRTAIERNIEVIPITVDDTPMPQPADLPTDIAALARRQAIEISPVALDVKRLIKAVRGAMVRQSHKALPPVWVSPDVERPITPVSPDVVLPARGAPEPDRRLDRVGLAASFAGGLVLIVALVLVLVLGVTGSVPAASALPDDHMVVPISVAGGEPDLWVVSRDGGQPIRQLTTSSQPDLLPNLSPDRRTVVYRRLLAGSPARGSVLRVMAVDGHGDRPIFSTDLCPEGFVGHAWNPAVVSQLAVTCETRTGNSAFLVGTDGGVLRPLPIPGTSFGDLSFSPDGKQLAFWTSPTFRPTGAPQGGAIAVLELATDQVSMVTAERGNLDADAIWSPTAAGLLAFRRRSLRTEDSNIMTVRVDGSDLQSRTQDGADEDFPSFSPDGTQIAYRSRQKIVPLPSRPRLWILDVDTRSPRPVWDGTDAMNTNSVGKPSWTSR